MPQALRNISPPGTSRRFAESIGGTAKNFLEIVDAYFIA